MRPLVRLLTALSLLALPAAAGAGTARDPAAAAETLGLICAPATSADGVEYTRCTGEITSFDGVGLDTDLSLPRDGKPPYPTILMLHGWSGDKTGWQSPTRDGGTNPDKYHWNDVWFVSKGYAVVNYTARGFKESCGQLDMDQDCLFPNRAWTHLADRRWETRDSQHMLGVLVDEGIADPQRLASTGGSYGGGQSWLLATSMPWTSPGGHTGLRLAGAVAKYPWTDLQGSLTPNGRASDDLNQGPSHEQPFGVAKESYIDGLYAAGRGFGEGRYNTSDPSELHSDVDAQFALIQGGEPYDATPVTDLLAAEYRHKSPYYAEQYFAALSAGSVEPVPVFSIQGWTDPLFPAVETLQMYRKLKAADPEYPVYMAFGDIGHSNAQNPPYQWQHINDQGNQFLNAFVLGQGEGTPTTNVFAFVTRCPKVEGPEPVLAGTSWDQMAAGRVTAAGEGSRTTTSAPPDTEELDTDPILRMNTCLTNGTGAKPGTWTWTVPGDGFTQLGLPEVKVSYAMTGADATVAFKLWDVPSSGNKVLVDRGLYRLSVAGGDPPNGTIDLDLFGNAWRFEPGHRIQLQIAQTDSLYLRPDNLPSSITWSNLELTLPIRLGFDLTLPAV